MAQEDLNTLTDRAQLLEDSLGGAAEMAASFDKELNRMRGAVAATERDVQTLERGLSKGLRRAFDDLVFDGVKLSDALDTIAQSMIRTSYNAAVKPVSNHVSGFLTDGLSNVIGGLFGGGGDTGIATAARSIFGTGGEIATQAPARLAHAAPAQAPQIARAPDPIARAAPVSVVMNVQTPDVQSFQRSQTQIAAQMSRAMARGNRNA
ncbi:phage tail tape measure protein [Epibacterium ulvae]|uniref:phage tail tape measure protein n=1 Tax=Epibacterium ulvae TaxID=1156985 RepID=UPI0024924860|nr:phage tail tape measure protein [Epibacterium ulvae]